MEKLLEDEIPQHQQIAQMLLMEFRDHEIADIYGERLGTMKSKILKLKKRLRDKRDELNQVESAPSLSYP